MEGEPLSLPYQTRVSQQNQISPPPLTCTVSMEKSHGVKAGPPHQTTGCTGRGLPQQGWLAPTYACQTGPSWGCPQAAGAPGRPGLACLHTGGPHSLGAPGHLPARSHPLVGLVGKKEW